MYTIGINNSLDRLRIRKLLIIGIFAALITGIGDFLLGFAEETSGTNLATSIMSSAPNLPDWQLITGGLLGMVGIFFEGLALFAMYRLIVDTAPKLAHIYRSCIFIYIWLAPVGCHMNVGLLNMAYKYILQADGVLATQIAGTMYYPFSFLLYALLVPCCMVMIVIQFRAFSKGFTPYPTYAKWFNLFTGAIPALVLASICGVHTALGAGIGTMFISIGYVFTFGGLLATLPDEKTFESFRHEFQPANN